MGINAEALTGKAVRGYVLYSTKNTNTLGRNHSQTDPNERRREKRKGISRGDLVGIAAERVLTVRRFATMCG